MPFTKVHFKMIHQVSQTFGSDNEHMVSRVYFDLEVSGETIPNLYADVKQPVGSDFLTDPLEVPLPEDYSGPLSYEGYRDAVEKYYRMSFGSQGGGIRFGTGAKNIVMQDNIVERRLTMEF